MAQILVVDDEVGIRELLSEILADEGHDVITAENATRAREIRSSNRPDLVLLDIWMPDADGLTLLKEWASAGLLTMPVVMMSGHATIDTAVEATRIGALDFLEKPIALQKLLATVKRALGQAEVRVSRPGGVFSLAALKSTRSPALTNFRKRLNQAGASAAGAILLRGDRGAMPEFYARVLQAPMNPWVNATPALVDGAPDVLPQAAGGVLFIDDLARLASNQRKHLAFLVPRALRAKVRIVSFSSENPQTLIDETGFDPVLMASLAEITLLIPPLRDAADDIAEIALAVLRQVVESGGCPARIFDVGALVALGNYNWPGNLEELFGVVRTLATTAPAETIDASEVAVVIQRDEVPRGIASVELLGLPLREAREAFERAYFQHHLIREGGAISKVAEKSGLERTHLYRKLKALGITTHRKDGES